jgi:hypothetical protein
VGEREETRDGQTIVVGLRQTLEKCVVIETIVDEEGNEQRVSKPARIHTEGLDVQFMDALMSAQAWEIRDGELWLYTSDDKTNALVFQ